MLKEEINQPVTFWENYGAWLNKISRLAEEVDFISLHTYPQWEFKNIYEAIGYTKENYNSVKSISHTYNARIWMKTSKNWIFNYNIHQP